MTVIVIIIIVTLWFFTGWLGYLCARYWVTDDSDFTRGDRAFYGAFIILGPLNLVTGASFALEVRRNRRPSRSNEVLRPRRTR